LDSCYCLLSDSWLFGMGDYMKTAFNCAGSAMLKQLHAHKTENRLERGLVEGEENVRLILLSHFWSVAFTIILLLVIWIYDDCVGCQLNDNFLILVYFVWCFCLISLNCSCLLPLFGNCFSFTPSYAIELFFSFSQQWLFLILCLVLCFLVLALMKKKRFHFFVCSTKIRLDCAS
jgi:membrane-associated HD superfamily phosphohydrolase